MQINFVCRLSKARKNGQSPFEMSIIINGERKVVTLKRCAYAANFDTKRQNVKGDSAANEYLEAIRAKLYAQN